MAKYYSNFTFYLALRCACILCVVITLFCIALSDGWTSRLPSVIGMLFLLLSCLLIASSIATLFYWNIQNSSLVKRCIFIFLFALCCLISGIMFLQANNYCDAYGQQFGCFQYYYSSNSYKVAAAFSFIAIIFAALDIVLNFLFYFFDERYRIGQGDPKDAKSKYRAPSTEPQISVIGSADYIPANHQPHMITGKSTYV